MGLCQMGRQFCENSQCFQVKAKLLGVFNHVTMISVGPSLESDFFLTYLKK